MPEQIKEPHELHPDFEDLRSKLKAKVAQATAKVEEELEAEDDVEVEDQVEEDIPVTTRKSKK